jgi:Peptidase family C25/Secretion system C-terminal sorting domain/Propeptide_C25
MWIKNSIKKSPLKRSSSLILICTLLLLSSISSRTLAGTITERFNFDQNELKFKTVDGFDLPSFRDWLPTMEVGKPLIPYADFQILIPSTAEVTGVKVVSAKKVEIAGEHYIYPAQPPITTDQVDKPALVPPDQLFYNSEKEYPVKLASFTPTGTKSGYRLSGIQVYPIRYIPKQRKLFLYTDIVLEIVYQEGKVTEQALTESQKKIFGAEVRSLIMNTKDFDRFSPSTKLVDQSNDIDYLIITSSSLSTNFQTLADWKTKKGWNTKIRTTTWINSNYTGDDLQEKIRNYIRTCYADSSLKFVLLAGDNSIVPARLAWANVNTLPATIDTIPCDLYYADLQWSWDGNQNNIYGDTFHVSGKIDTVDLYSDIYIGRVSVENATEISNFTNKLLTYEKNPDTAYIKRVLLPWGILWSGYNSKQSEDSIASFTPAGWTDRYINNTVVTTEVRDSLNHGFQFCHLVGHGNELGVYWTSSGPEMYYYTHPAAQTNVSKYVIANSNACYSGSFDYEDCLAEDMINVTNCAVGVIMNSRYGWGTPPVLGPSELLDIRFYDFFFLRDTARTGAANARSKEFYRDYAYDDGCWRWCYYELNLFGDPEMMMWQDVPVHMTAGFDDTITIGSQTFSVTVTDPSLDAPVANAQVSLWKGTEVYERGNTNSSGVVNFTINPLTSGPMLVTASAFNHFPVEDTSVVFIQNDDVGTVAILAPVGLVDSTNSIVPRCSVYNYGPTLIDSFPVIFKIMKPFPPMTWSDTQKVYNLGSGNGTSVTFDPWTVGTRGIYNTSCSTALAIDIDPTNDRKDSSFTIAAHDVAVMGIDVPMGMVRLDSAITPVARIRNYGSVPDSFNVFLRIGASYVDTFFLRVAVGFEYMISFRTWVAAPVGTFEVRCSTDLASDLITFNDTLSDSVKVYDNDVGVVSILKPFSSLDSTSAIVPSCSVYNYSSQPATFQVRFNITGPANYNNTQTVNNLAAGSGVAVLFAPWTIGPTGNYMARCSTELSPDTNKLNDTLSAGFKVVRHDVGTTQIIAPKGLVILNSSVQPQVVVRNFGTQIETFDVSLVVLTPVPSSWTQSVTVDSGHIDTVNFSPNWLATPTGTFAVRCSTSLANDSFAANNLRFDSVIVSDADVGVLSILEPAGTLDSTSTIVPRCSVYNYSSSPATFPVTFRISGTPPYSNTQTVIGLPPNSGIAVSFAPWTVGPRGNYTTQCTTMIANDINPVNDTLSGSFNIIVHDVGATQILAPKGLVVINSLIPPKTIVQNFGTQAETFDVSLAVLTPVPSTWTQSVTINSGQVDTINFAPNWTATPSGTWSVRCSTALADDSVPINNLKIDSVTVSDADVGVTAINWPTGAIDSTQTLTPQASVFNYSTNPASFSVILRITGPATYSNTKIVTLPGGIGQIVSFDPWTIGPRGLYTVRCTTALSYDTSTVNDTMSQQFEIIVHDIGTAQILAPSGVVPLNRTITPQTIVQNYGTETETFDVSLLVLTPVPSSWTLTRTLTAGQVDTVSFAPNWTATPLGTYPVRCSTALARDSVAVNNLKIDSVIISDDDVGVTEIIYPTGDIDSSATLIPQARVFNYGTTSVTFPVTFNIIGPVNYTNTQTVNNLAPNTSTTIAFSAWNIGPRGNYLARCSTELFTDTNALNDTLSAPFRIKVHDVGSSQILAPAGIVPLNSSITPQAIVQNFGTESDTSVVTLSVLSPTPISWTDTIPLDAGQIDTASFSPPWLATPIGTYPVRCSTALTGDLVIVNDTISDSVTVAVYDVAVNNIVAPVGIIDSAATPNLTPQASITNYAGVAVSFPAIFRISKGVYTWADTQSVNLNAGETQTVNFGTWAVGIGGVYTTRCTTALAGDVNLANNWSDSSFYVRVPGGDVGVTALILNPPGPNIDSGTTVSISARVKNFGTDAATFQVKAKIGTFYLDSLLTPLVLNPGDSQSVSFANWIAVQRGTRTVRCSTELAGDIYPSNDRQTRNIAVVIRDVRTLSILTPSGNVDSVSTPLIPQAKVENVGTVMIDSFPVIFQIAGPVAYADTKMVRNLSASEQRTVNFAPWDIGPIGAYTTACSTAYVLDMNTSNDRHTGQFWVQRCDIGVDSIVSPLGSVDSGSTALVKASITNFGTSTKSFLAVFRIGSFYADTVPVTLASLDDSVISFNDWIANEPGGSYAMQCTTVIANDFNDSNNQVSDSILIGVKDVGVDSILNPMRVVSPGPVTPQARVHNHGTDLTSFLAYFRIRNASGIVYFDSAPVNNLAPDSIFDVTFPSTWTAVNGSYIATCSLALANDMITANDTMYRLITVTVLDVQPIRIVYPGRRTLKGPVQPRIVIRNNSAVPQSFWNFFLITDTVTGATVYFDSTYTSINAFLQQILDFSVWTATFGNYALKAWTGLIGDANPANDTMTGLCRVDTVLVPKWSQKSDVPIGPRGRYVMRGGTITYGGNNLLYALKGSNTNEFYSYDPATDSWKIQETIPYAPERKKRVSNGAAMCSYGSMNTIFAIKGSNTFEFWAYIIPYDTWVRLPDVPPGNKRVKTGSGLAFASTALGDNIYCLKGSKTFEFYAYSIANNTWTALRPAPAGYRGKPMGQGSAMTYDPYSQKIYAMKGIENEFFSYDIATDTWTTLAAVPLYGVNGSKRAKDGASLAADGNGQIYAFKGNNSQEFLIYHIDEDWWEQVEPIPLGPNMRKVKQGGSLTYSPFSQKIYALKGNRTRELWQFDPNAFIFANTPTTPMSSNTNEVKSELADITQFKIIPNPNPGRFTINYQLGKINSIKCCLYNVLGNMVFEQTTTATNKTGTVKIDAKGIPTGIYIIRLQSGNNEFVGKILIQK